MLCQHFLVVLKQYTTLRYIRLLVRFTVTNIDIQIKNTYTEVRLDYVAIIHLIEDIEINIYVNLE